MNEFLYALLNAPSEAWVGLLGVVVGAVVSICGVWLSNRSGLKQLSVQLAHERLTKAEELKREKYEELYILVDKWLNEMTALFLDLRLVMLGDMDYNQHLDRVIERGKEKLPDFSRLDMIVYVYGNELENTYKEMMNARDKFNEIESKYKRAYRNGDFDGKNFIDPLYHALKNVIQVSEKFKGEIAKCASSP